MKISEIHNHQELLNITKTNQLVYCLIHKSDNRISICANEKLKQATDKINEGILCTVDVKDVKDIHTHYNVSTAPTLIVFENNKMINQIKGCNDVSFYENLMQGTFFTSNETKQKLSVTVYSTPTCSHCTSLKSYLKKHNISYRDIDLTQNPSETEALVKRTGQQGVPQTNINGKFVVGFNIQKLNELLNINN